MNALVNEQVGDVSLDLEGELPRFRMIVRRHASASGSQRYRLRQVLVKYLKYSPQSDVLLNELILECIEQQTPDRLDIAIDILSQLGADLFEYAYQFFCNDITQWNHLYHGRAYEPDDDYWYILLRSVARADIEETKKLFIIWSCREASSRGIVEGVAEALGDIGTKQSQQKLRVLTEHTDPFIAELAHELLEG